MNTFQIDSGKKLISGAIVLAAVILILGYGYINRDQLHNLSAQQAADKTIAFINDNIEKGTVASLVSVTNKGMVYQVSLQINGTPYESFITKDGNFLFPTGINLIEKPTEQVANTEETASSTKSTATASESFAKCLTSKGMKFYGSKNCSWCAKEKTLLGDALQYINYIECVGNDGQWSKVCQDANITSVPTWQMPDGTKESGFKTLEALAEKSGCSL